MNIAERIKKQTDKILRQQSQGPNAGMTIIETGAGGKQVSNPAVDLARHKTSGDHDSRYAQAFTDLGDVPSSYAGAGGKIIRVKDDLTGLEFISAPPAENGIPTGGANNQLLAKDGTDDYAVKWVNAPAAANGIPAGGTAGQVLAKVDDTNYNVQWIDAPSGGGVLEIPVPFASSVYSDKYIPAYAFDGKVATYWSANGDIGQYIGINFKESVRVTKIYILDANGRLKDFVFEGSIDDTIYTPLLTTTRTQVTTETEHLVPNDDGYVYYRLRCVSALYAGSNMTMHELRMEYQYV